MKDNISKSSAGNEYIHYCDPSSLTDEIKNISDKERAILDMINQRVAGGRSLDEIMNFLFENLPCPCERLGLSFLEDNGQRVTAHWARTNNKTLLLEKGFWQAMSGSSLERVLNTGEIRIINDLEKYSSENPNSISTKLVLKEGVMSSMTCPIKVDERPLGFLFRSSSQKNAYEIRHVAMHAIVAERIGQAVEKAYRIEQLSDMNKAYTEMLAFVSHEIKNPISSIIMDSSLLLKGYLGDLNTQQAEKIHKLETKAKFLLELTKDYLNLARIESGRLQPDFRKDINFRELIDDSLAVLETQIESKKSEVKYEFRGKDFSLECDPDLIKIVLINLIGNAVKYGYNACKVKIIIEHNRQELAVSVWNEGPGFGEEDKPRLFRKFSRLKRKELITCKGSGVGLYTVWQIITAHNGKVSAASELGKWAEFSFKLPCVRGG